MLIGIDGGGTKNDLVLAENDGCVRKAFHGEGANPADLGVERACARLMAQIDALLHDFGGSEVRIDALYAGLSGGGSPALKADIHALMAPQYPNISLFCNESDALNAVYGELGAQDGAVLIAGTGSVAFLLAGGKSVQVGGWGYLIDDAGGGYWVGHEVLCAAYRAFDGRGAATALMELCRAQLGCAFNEAIPRIYEGGKRYVASFAPLAFAAAQGKDEVACAIVERTAQALAAHLQICRQRAGTPHLTAVLCGGLWHANLLLEKVHALLPQSEFTLLMPTMPPVFGALVAAGQRAGVDTGNTFRKNFLATYPQK